MYTETDHSLYVKQSTDRQVHFPLNCVCVCVRVCVGPAGLAGYLLRAECEPL